MSTYHLSKAMSEETQNKVARTSNVVGQVAGVAGLGTAATAFHAMRKTPSAQRVGGPVTRRLAANMPKTRGGKFALAGAGGALALQAGNVVGDAVTSRVLARADRDTKVKNQALRSGTVAKARKSFNTPDSAWIEGADYNTRTKTLTMRTRRGDAYDYPETPRRVYRKMNRSESVGEFYNQNLKLQPVKKAAAPGARQKRPEGVRNTYSGSAASGARDGAKAMLPLSASLGALAGAGTFAATRLAGASKGRSIYSGAAQGALTAGKVASVGGALGAGVGLASRKYYGRSEVRKTLALPAGKSAVRNTMRNRAVNRGRILANRARTAPGRVDRAAQRLGDRLGAAKMTSLSPNEGVRTAVQGKAETTLRTAYEQRQRADRMSSQARSAGEKFMAAGLRSEADMAGFSAARTFNSVRQDRARNYTRNKRLLGYGVPAAAAAGAAVAGEQIHEKVRKGEPSLTPRQEKAKATLKASQVSMGANLAGVAGLGLMAASPLVARKNKALGVKVANARNVTGALATGGFSTAGLMNYKRAKEDARAVGVAKYYDPEVNRERRMRTYETASATSGVALGGAAAHAGVKARSARKSADATRSAAHAAANGTWQKDKRAAWSKYPTQAADARILRTNDGPWVKEASKAKTKRGTPYKNPKTAPVYRQMKADAAKNADDMVRRARTTAAASASQASARRTAAMDAANKAHRTASTARRFIKPGALAVGAAAAGGAAIAANKYRKKEFGADGRAGGW